MFRAVSGVGLVLAGVAGFAFGLTQIPDGGPTPVVIILVSAATETAGFLLAASVGVRHERF